MKSKLLWIITILFLTLFSGFSYAGWLGRKKLWGKVYVPAGNSHNTRGGVNFRSFYGQYDDLKNETLTPEQMIRFIRHKWEYWKNIIGIQSPNQMVLYYKDREIHYYWNQGKWRLGWPRKQGEVVAITSYDSNLEWGSDGFAAFLVRIARETAPPIVALRSHIGVDQTFGLSPTTDLSDTHVHRRIPTLGDLKDRATQSVRKLTGKPSHFTDQRFRKWLSTHYHDLQITPIAKDDPHYPEKLSHQISSLATTFINPQRAIVFSPQSNLQQGVIFRLAPCGRTIAQYRLVGMFAEDVDRLDESMIEADRILVQSALQRIIQTDDDGCFSRYYALKVVNTHHAFVGPGDVVYFVPRNHDSKKPTIRYSPDGQLTHIANMFQTEIFSHVAPANPIWEIKIILKTRGFLIKSEEGEEGEEGKKTTYSFEYADNGAQSRVRKLLPQGYTEEDIIRDMIAGQEIPSVKLARMPIRQDNLEPAVAAKTARYRDATVFYMDKRRTAVAYLMNDSGAKGKYHIYLPSTNPKARDSSFQQQFLVAKATTPELETKLVEANVEFMVVPKKEFDETVGHIELVKSDCMIFVPESTPPHRPKGSPPAGPLGQRSPPVVNIRFEQAHGGAVVLEAVVAEATGSVHTVATDGSGADPAGWPPDDYPHMAPST